MKRVLPVLLAAAMSALAAPPNLIFILVDDMGHADLGCYGQQKIHTPRIDRLAAEGMRFSQAYCGTSVCAPSRCALMTGLNMGHAPIRANREIKPEGQMPLPASTLTVAEVLKSAGYATACIGKWGLGFVGTEGDPNQQGFDHFFGYNCQRQAHNFYPTHLWRNAEKIPLGGTNYSHDLMTAEALDWVKAHKAGPFFLYLPYTAPHETIAVPELEDYVKDQPWTEHQKTYASIVSRMDRDVGRLVDLLGELGIASNTLVFFASDNGADGSDRGFFRSNGDLRGIKRSMYEGGIRAPLIAWWPGTIKAGAVAEVPVAFWDFLPTAARLADAPLPPETPIDGVSFADYLKGGEAPPRNHLYWELHEPHFMQAVRQGEWKLVRPKPDAPVELYNLTADPAETNNLAAAESDRVAKMTKLLCFARIDDPNWPVRDGAKKPGK